MADAKQKTVALLDSATVHLQAGDPKSIVYTVPPGKKGVPLYVVIRNPTASLAAGTDFDIGDGAGADTWKTAIDLSSLTAATDCIVIPASTGKFTIYAAGAEFGIIPVTGATADADATMDVFEYEYEA